MPIARFRLEDGRIARFRVPEGYTQEEAQRDFDEWYAAQEAAKEDSRFINIAKKAAIRQVRDVISLPKAIGEIPLALATGLGATALGGWKGMLGGGEEAIRKTAEDRTYAPRTEVAQKVLSAIAYPFEVASKGWSEIGQRIAGDEGEAIGGAVVPVLGTIASGRPAANMLSKAIPKADIPVQTALKNLGSLPESGLQSIADLGVSAQKSAADIMLSALKPRPEDYASNAASIASQELLSRNIPLNIKGMSRLSERISELEAEVNSSVAGSTRRVNLEKALSRLKDAQAKFSNTPDAAKDIATIGKIGERVRALPSIPTEYSNVNLRLQPSTEIPVQLAQQIKKNTQKVLRSKNAYGKSELGSAETEGQMAVARGFREEVAQAHPELVPLLQEESNLLSTLGVAERAVFNQLNADPPSLFRIARSPKIWAEITADRSRAFKSLLARRLYSIGKSMEGLRPPQEGVIPYTKVSPPKSGITFTAETPEAIPYEQFAREYRAGKVIEKFPLEPVIKREQAKNTAKRMAEDQAIIDAELSAPRKPASGGVALDIDASTGMLRPFVPPQQMPTQGIILPDKAKIVSQDTLLTRAKLREEAAKSLQNYREDYANFALEANKRLRESALREPAKPLTKKEYEAILTARRKEATKARIAQEKELKAKADELEQQRIAAAVEELRMKAAELESLQDALSPGRPKSKAWPGKKALTKKRGMLTGDEE